ncbi:MAG TPA: zinc-ribbon domain-containing protein [Ignavibacteriaceae bacterium]|jgi:hypothetical protein
MLILGVQEKQLLSKPINVYCPNCKSENTSKIKVAVNYFNLFWIPVFPFNKKVKVDCSACNFQTDLDGMPEEFKDKIDKLKNSIKTPKWLFTGTLLIILAAMFFTFESIRKAGIEKLINAPMAGDVYEIKTQDNYYSLLAIVKVSGDSVFVCFHNYQYENRAGLTELHKTNDFNKQAYLYYKDELIYNFRDGLILNIIRGTTSLDLEYVIQEEPKINPDNAKKYLDDQSGPRRSQSAKPAHK